MSGAGSYTADEALRWFGTARGRVGVAWDRVLLFATGGLAYGQVKADADPNSLPAIQYPSSTSTTKIGWAAGGGLEWAFASNWSGKIEGLYYDLGSISISGAGAPAPDGYTLGKTFDVRGAIVRAGLNYKFW